MLESSRTIHSYNLLSILVVTAIGVSQCRPRGGNRGCGYTCYVAVQQTTHNYKGELLVEHLTMIRIIQYNVAIEKAS